MNINETVYKLDDLEVASLEFRILVTGKTQKHVFDFLIYFYQYCRLSRKLPGDIPYKAKKKIRYYSFNTTSKYHSYIMKIGNGKISNISVTVKNPNNLKGGKYSNEENDLFNIQSKFNAFIELEDYSHPPSPITSQVKEQRIIKFKFYYTSVTINYPGTEFILLRCLKDASKSEFDSEINTKIRPFVIKLNDLYIKSKMITLKDKKIKLNDRDIQLTPNVLKNKIIKNIIKLSYITALKRYANSSYFDLVSLYYFEIETLDVSEYSICLSHFAKCICGCEPKNSICYCGCISSQHALINFQIKKVYLKAQLSDRELNISPQSLQSLANDERNTKFKIAELEEILKYKDNEYKLFNSNKQFCNQDEVKEKFTEIRSFTSLKNEISDDVEHIILVIGEEGSGKTCLLQSLINFLEKRDYLNLLKLKDLGSISLSSDRQFRYYFYNNPSDKKIMFIDSPGVQTTSNNSYDEVSRTMIIKRIKKFNKPFSIIIVQKSNDVRMNLSMQFITDYLINLTEEFRFKVYVAYSFKTGPLVFNKELWGFNPKSIHFDNNIYALLDARKQSKNIEAEWEKILKKISIFWSFIFSQIEKQTGKKQKTREHRDFQERGDTLVGKAIENEPYQKNLIEKTKGNEMPYNKRDPHLNKK